MALRRWAFEDPAVQSERQRITLDKRFQDLVDPDRVLDEAERARRADRLRRAHMAEMTRASILARKKVSAATNGPADREELAPPSPDGDG